MTRLLTLVLAVSLCAGSLVALGRNAGATPPYELPSTRAAAAFDSLAARGLIAGYPSERVAVDQHLTRHQMAVLVAHQIERLRVRGPGRYTAADLDLLQRVANSVKDELILLGVRDTNIQNILHPQKQAAFTPTLETHGAIALDESLRQRGGIPRTIAGGMVDPFVNAFLTSPADNNPFEHDAGAGDLFRFDSKFNITYNVSKNLAISLPLHIVNYQYNGEFLPQNKYAIEPALVMNLTDIGALRNLHIRAGQLDDLESSRLGLTYRAPDATQQGPGFQNPVQPYENGVEIGGLLGSRTQFQVALSWVNQSMVETFPGLGDQFAYNNYFTNVSPPANSLVQPGPPSAAVAANRTDTYTANAGPLTAVYLSMKAAVGTVYVSAVNGTACTSTGLTTGGGACPIGTGSWYYIDEANQVVFRSPLPAGSTVQISYAVLNTNYNGAFSNYNYQYQRYHFSARLNHEIKGIPGAQVGFSASRVFDAGTFASGVSFGDGYGALSDTVYGLDARLPLWFINLDKDRMSHPVLYGEGAYSKYSPDARNTPAITDSAVALGLRLKVFGVTGNVQYQNVGPDFFDGGTLRFFGPAPSTFGAWRGNYMPGFFGFGNDLAINKTFDASVFPGCAATCTSRNAALTYIYPVFNPFVASGPQYYSAFAPNSRGLTATLSAPLEVSGQVFAPWLRYQHLSEIQPNGFAQVFYGPGFSSSTLMKFDTIEGGLKFDLPVLDTKAAIELKGSSERLARNDRTAYSYLPFNTMTGGPDAASGAGLNAFLAGGATPILFYPSYVNESHTTYSAGATVPVARAFDLGFMYNTQMYTGAYGTTIVQNISQRKDVYSGSLSYALPKTNSIIGFIYGNQTYTDNTLPTFNFSQAREDLTFTIRF
jgi:hypothetical protein